MDYPEYLRNVRAQEQRDRDRFIGVAADAPAPDFIDEVHEWDADRPLPAIGGAVQVYSILSTNALLKGYAIQPTGVLSSPRRASPLGRMASRKRRR